MCGQFSGYVCLAETCGGVLQALCGMWGREGDVLYHRYYRSYIRAFNDAKDAAKKVREDDDDYVTRDEFRLLLRYLSIYATWYEVFLSIDTDADHRISRDEFIDDLPNIVKAGRTWAESLAFAHATAGSFEEIDQNVGGYCDLQEFCEWVEKAEKLGHTAQGDELGVNEPIDRPAHEHRNWHTSELEMRPVDKQRIEERHAAEHAAHVASAKPKPVPHIKSAAVPARKPTAHAPTASKPTAPAPAVSKPTAPAPAASKPKPKAEPKLKPTAPRPKSAVAPKGKKAAPTTPHSELPPAPPTTPRPQAAPAEADVRSVQCQESLP